MLHRIQKIINIAPYTILCEWTNGEVRAIQMEAKIREWADEPGSVYKNLLDTNTFMQVMLDAESKTLFWDGLIKIKDATGKLINAALDIDPEVLYLMSIPVRSEDNKAA